MRIPHVKIIDSTLREGEQTPGVVFTDEARRRIIAGLYLVGIDEIELGIATPLNRWLPDLVTEARKLTKGACHLSLWCRCLKEDIAFAASCRPDLLSLSIPVSDIHIRERLRKNKDWVKKNLARSIRQAKSLNIPSISVGLEDASKADINFILDVAKTAKQHGAERIRLADTVGTCSPGTMQQLVLAVKKSSNINIGVHCHNDFGMATANSIAALEAGASSLDATVLGLGERAGNCRLEEVTGYLALVLHQSQYRTQALPELCRYVADVTNKEIADNHPLVGAEIFTCESGLHQHGLTVNPSMYEPYEPAHVGGQRQLRFGHKIGRKAVRLYLEKLGVRLNEMQIKHITDRIRTGGKILSEGQLLRFAAKESRSQP
ncbi:MAG: hypothetical protein D3925_08505 [Candidatus Electrothrix sp. AR5]|nr:hypothetical protein [Candidatus Electrothrix sp. AR5]